MTKRKEKVVQPIPGVLQLLDTRQAAQALGLKAQTLYLMRSKNRIRIPYVRVGSRIKYRPEDLARFAEENLVRPA